MGSGHPGGELYFLALIPPETVYEQAWKIKEQMAAEYGSKAALRSPPHITLHMPFRMKERKEEALVSLLEDELEEAGTFPVELSGFGAFPPRVIYIAVRPSPVLTELYHQIRKPMQGFLHRDNADWKGRGFTPHLTVAFRDLKKSAFRRAWEQFREKPFEARWTVEGVTLLKHTGSRWEAHSEFQLPKR